MIEFIEFTWKKAKRNRVHMEESKENKPNYRIWHFGKDRWSRVTDEKFYAENDDAAYEHLVGFVNTVPVFDGRKFYYSHIHYVQCIDVNGKRSPEFDLDDRASRIAWHRRSIPWWKRALEEVTFFFSYYFIARPKDLYYWIRNIVYLLKHKEAYSNQWNLDWHILESIELNVPSLIENSCALAFINEAILEVHGNEPGFDLDQYHRDNYAGYPKEIEDLAMKIQNEEYRNLLLYVKLYKYYASGGDIDFNNPEEVDFDNNWRHTLPIKKGTYDEIADCKKLASMAREQWSKIWDWMKAYGQKLND